MELEGRGRRKVERLAAAWPIERRGGASEQGKAPASSRRRGGKLRLPLTTKSRPTAASTPVLCIPPQQPEIHSDTITMSIRTVSLTPFTDQKPGT